MMQQPTVVHFNSYVVHTTLPHFTDGCVSKVELKSQKSSYFSLSGLLQKEINLLWEDLGFTKLL